jgi:hypothetical protein
MSTFYATFKDVQEAQAVIDELLRGGVTPDDLSLIVRKPDVQASGNSGEPMIDEARTVGDATVFVGRDDDPRMDELVPPNMAGTQMQTREASRIMGIDTSNIAYDVDSVDQSDNSQEEAEEMTLPDRGISQSSHERDDLALAVTTGFPTTIPVADDIKDYDTPLQDQMTDSLESIVVPGFGLVIGGGALATVALSFLNPEARDGGSFVDHLKDEGVPEDRARSYQEAFDQGQALLAVAITPGEVNELEVERIADRHHGENQEMFDAPRFYEGGGRAEML